MKKYLMLFTVLVFSQLSLAEFVRGFSLTELGELRYDAAPMGMSKTPAQIRVDELYELGVRQINLHPRAKMLHPKANEVIPFTSRSERSKERRAYLRLMAYIHSKGMKVGIRPVFFVVDENGHIPYIDNNDRVWWHGNIQPSEPNVWFESFKTYLQSYMIIAKLGAADEFTLGAELYSMTVGIEDQWPEHPHGFPAQWVEILKMARLNLLPSTIVMYDINFTDDTIREDGVTQSGGELARWKYRLVDNADENSEYWQLLKEFWLGLDMVGIDMYRSLASDSDQIPEDYEELVKLLTTTSDRYVDQLDNVFFEIECALKHLKKVTLKEIGFKSVEKGFIRPFEYRGSSELQLNKKHQAAAYEAIFRSFWVNPMNWFEGIVWWDTSVSEELIGRSDRGFSPVGKTETEDVLKTYFGN